MVVNGVDGVRGRDVAPMEYVFRSILEVVMRFFPDSSGM